MEDKEKIGRFEKMEEGKQDEEGGGVEKMEENELG